MLVAVLLALLLIVASPALAQAGGGTDRCARSRARHDRGRWPAAVAEPPDPHPHEPADGAAVAGADDDQLHPIIIVLSILRQALGLQQTPPTRCSSGLALFLSMFVMRPALDQINANAFNLRRRPDRHRGGGHPIGHRPARLHGAADAADRHQAVRRPCPIATLADARAIPFSILLPAFVTIGAEDRVPDRLS
jgi:hypothetical protein